MTTPLLNTPAAPILPASRGRRLIDAPIRMFHTLFAVCFIGANLSADSEHWRLLHVTLGYILAGLLAFSLIYGLIGPR
jgi:cytochrome b